MRVGYARVSSEDQNLDRQLIELKKDGCRKLFTDEKSGKSTKRTGLHRMMNFIREGDIVEVVALDRLGRNKDDDLNILQDIKEKGATIDIANFDMMTPPKQRKGESVNHFKQRQNTYEFINGILIRLLAYVAETERREIKGRQRQGIEAAKKRGVYKGKFTRFDDENTHLQEAFKDYFNRGKNDMSVDRIAKMHGMSRSTLYKKLRKYKPKEYYKQFKQDTKTA